MLHARNHNVTWYNTNMYYVTGFINSTAMMFKNDEIFIFIHRFFEGV